MKEVLRYQRVGARPVDEAQRSCGAAPRSRVESERTVGRCGVVTDRRKYLDGSLGEHLGRLRYLRRRDCEPATAGCDKQGTGEDGGEQQPRMPARHRSAGPGGRHDVRWQDAAFRKCGADYITAAKACRDLANTRPSGPPDRLPDTPALRRPYADLSRLENRG